MARSEISTSFETFRRAEGWIHQAVTNFRNRGLCVPQAIEQAALDLEFSPRRVRAFYFGEANRLSIADWHALQLRFVAHLEADAAWLLKQSEKRLALKREIDAERATMARLRRRS